MKEMFSKLEKNIDARRRASKDFASFLKELALAGEIQLKTATQASVGYWCAQGRRTSSKEASDSEKISQMLGGDGVKAVFTWRGETYGVYFAHGDFLEKNEFGVFGEYFEQFVLGMKESGEYYYPDSTIPWWKIPGPGKPPVLIKEDKRAFLGEGSKLTTLEQKGGFYLSEDAVYCEGRQDYLSGATFLKLLPLQLEPEEYEKVKFFQNYLLIGRRAVFKDRPEEVFDGVQNPEDIVDDRFSKYRFQRNDDGALYFIPAGQIPEEMMEEFYETNHFSKMAKRLRESIEEKKRATEAAEAKRLREKEALEEFIRGESTPLIEVVFHQRSGGSDPSGSVVLHPDDTERGRYYEDDPVCQYLYGIQEKGWRGRAERGMLVNIPAAERAMQGGILHLDVPKSAMGRIIGTKGANIKAVKEALRKKGLSELKDIRLHPQN